MKQLRVSVVVLTSMVGFFACGGAQTKTETVVATKAASHKTTEASFKLMTAEQLQDRLAAAPPLTVVDVNSDARWAAGHVPGAKHILRENLSAETLPTNKDAMLVFYCGSAKCRASHKAARIAAGLGYTNVWVMTDGIKGWESKGLETEK